MEDAAHGQMTSLLDRVADGEDPGALVEDVPRGPHLGSARLRVEAGMVYMTDSERGSITKLLDDSRFSGVGRRTLERWCAEDKWVQRREQFLEHWASVARRRLGSQLVQSRIDELEELAEVRALAMEKIRDELTLPKSWEGVVKVLLDVNTRIEHVASDIGAEMMPPGSAESAEHTLASEASLGEVDRDAAVKAILAARRARLAAAAGPVVEATVTPVAVAVPAPSPLVDDGFRCHECSGLFKTSDALYSHACQ